MRLREIPWAGPVSKLANKNFESQVAVVDRSARSQPRKPDKGREPNPATKRQRTKVSAYLRSPKSSKPQQTEGKQTRTRLRRQYFSSRKGKGNKNSNNIASICRPVKSRTVVGLTSTVGAPNTPKRTTTAKVERRYVKT